MTPDESRPGEDISGASFYSYLISSPAWDRLTEQEKEAFSSRLPFQRLVRRNLASTATGAET